MIGHKLYISSVSHNIIIADGQGGKTVTKYMYPMKIRDAVARKSRLDSTSLDLLLF